MAKKVKLLSPMGFMGGSTMTKNMGKAEAPKTPSTPDPLGLVTTIGGKK